MRLALRATAGLIAVLSLAGLVHGHNFLGSGVSWGVRRSEGGARRVLGDRGPEGGSVHAQGGLGTRPSGILSTRLRGGDMALSPAHRGCKAVFELEVRPGDLGPTPEKSAAPRMQCPLFS